jgi:hypothetical protein
MFSDPQQSSAKSYSNPPRKARKRHKPIARLTSYDYNVFYDIRRKQEVRNGRANQEGLFSTPIRQESYNVMEGEILMSIDKSQTYRDGQLHCFSFANGLGELIPASLKNALTSADSTTKKHAKTLTRFIIMSRLSYVGIAVTGFDASHDRYQDVTQGFVGTFAGLNTIVNTGTREVKPGDWIRVGLPENFKWEDDPYLKAKQQEGIPLDKLLFTTEVVTPHTDSEKIKEIIDAVKYFKGNSTDATRKKVAAQLADSLMPQAIRDLKDHDFTQPMIVGGGGEIVKEKKMLRVVTTILHAHRRFIIGKALSFARIGEPFDICLGGSNSL